MSDRRRQVIDQCKAAAHMARTIADVYESHAKLLEQPEISGIVSDARGPPSARAMETLGDLANAMDIVTEEDDWTAPIFERAQVIFPKASS
jgi:hypothetical protein